MAFRFPFSTLHELNLDWILEKVKTFAELIPPMETAVSEVQELSTDVQQAVEDAQQALEDAGEAIQTAEEAKEIAEQAAQGTIADGAVTTAKLDDEAVTTAKIADGAVTSAKIASGTIQSSNLSSGCVTTTQILDGTISPDDLGVECVTASKLGTGAVTTAKINDGAVTTDKLGAGAVTNAKIADGTVTSVKLSLELNNLVNIKNIANKPLFLIVTKNYSTTFNSAGYNQIDTIGTIASEYGITDISSYELISMNIHSFGSGNIYNLARGSTPSAIYAIGAANASSTFGVEYVFINSTPETPTP